MKISLYGGFQEKGRTCIGVETRGASFLLDVGINTSARETAYYPMLTPEILRHQQAILLTHAHEDHVGALGWCYAHGFDGELFMTEETLAETPATLADYAEPPHRNCLERARVRLVDPGDTWAIGDCTIATGRSGHVVGGIWFAVTHHDRTLVYCGDMVPASLVFRMDPPPRCDTLLLDASYGDDPIPMRERSEAIAQWVAAHPGPSVLPTPLAGRSLELILAIPSRLWIHASMRASLVEQISARQWLQPAASAELSRRLSTIEDWQEPDALPPGPILCHDGMGMAGPSAALIERARRDRLPVLLTGHLPSQSPAELLHQEHKADWIRMPTHATRPENIDLAAMCHASKVIGHSCLRDDLDRLAPYFPTGLTICRTGEFFEM